MCFIENRKEIPDMRNSLADDSSNRQQQLLIMWRIEMELICNEFICIYCFCLVNERGEPEIYVI